MASPENNPELPLDQQLRNVPLPEGLTARLRAAVLADDEVLDALLRAVSLPDGLISRLRRAVLGEDDALDVLLQQVPVPEGFIERLRAALSTAVPSQQLGVAVVAERPGTAARGKSAVGKAGQPQPVGAERVHRLAGRLAHVSHWIARVAAAAHPSVWAAAMVVWLVVGLSVLGVIAVRGWLDSAADSIARIRVPPLTVVAAEESPLLFADPVWQARSMPLPVGCSDDLLPPVDLDYPCYQRELEAWGSDCLPGWARGAGGVARLLERPWLRWRQVLASPSSELDRLPELKKVSGPAPRGVCPPLVPQFPLDWYNRHGVFPFVVPGAHRRLQTSVVPLDVDTASYDLMRRYLEDGELPQPRDIHTEHFLAAIDYAFPAPRRQPLAVHVAAGPSPFGGEGLTLLQIGVQGRHFQRNTGQAMQLVLAVDVSGSMRWGGRLDMIRKALGRFIEQIGPQDRMWLVKFSEQAEVLLAGAGVANRQEVVAVLSGLRAEDSTNIAAGLHAAFREAEKAAEWSSVPTRVVLLTDGAGALHPDTALALMHAIGQYGPQLRLDVIDLGQSPQADPQLAALARSGGGRVYRACSAGQVNWALLEILTGQSQRIAADVRLEVTFDPGNVVQYRLLGHEAVVLLDSPTECDFFVGQWATALYELRLSPSGGQRIAAVELSWQPCEGGERQRIRRVVNRREFVPKLQQAPGCLKAAAIAAQTAEILRRVPIPRTSTNFGDALALAEQVETELRSKPDFVEFMAAVRQLAARKP